MEEAALDLRHLRYFVAVAEDLHFTRAAGRLGIAPPTLTVQIRELEQHLSALLFRRAQRSVTLTPAGEAFLPEAYATLAQFDRAESIGRRAGRGEVGRVALGYVGSAAFAGVLQAQVALYRQDHPGVEIHSQELPMPEIPGLLENGRLDIAFVRPPLRLPVGLRLHVLLRDRFCLALPAGHALAGLPGPADPRDLSKELFVLPEQESGTQEVGRRAGFVPRLGPRPGSLIAVLTQVSLGTGVAVLPSVMMQVARLPGVEFRALKGAPILSEIAAVFRRQERSPAAGHFIRQITAVTPGG
jgi:DNA-binding transcriptional LysR family regulator